MPHTTPNYDALRTEQSGAARDLDLRSPSELVALIHHEDQRALDAVGRAGEDVATIVAAVEHALDIGGRLIYIGAGTSGRLGVLDAAECPPTFNTRPRQIVGLIAGGPRALRRAVEGAEDSRSDGREAMRTLSIDAKDVVCGISASGSAAYVGSALREAKRRGAKTALITCAPRGEVAEKAETIVALEVGPEVVAGSTRMKAGLATKAVLHSITTAAMIRSGKVYDNLMVDVQPTNLKLRRRATRLVAQLAQLSLPAAGRLLRRSGDSVKTAVVMARLGLERREATRRLAKVGGRLRALMGGSL